MEIEQVLTKRGWKHDFFWEIVHEWEDEYARSLGVSVKKELPIFRDRMQKYGFLSLLQSRKKSLSFEMFGFSERINNLSNIVPIVIDLYPTAETLQTLKKRYCNHKCVLISSKEAYERLKKANYPLPLYHHALSLPDKYNYEKNIEKQDKTYDIVFMGRTNPVLKGFADKYILSHPTFKYVIKEKLPGSFNYYDSNGNFVCDCKDREDYFSLMRKSRIALYTTSDMDNDRGEKTEFHQVTPRFLELLSCGCKVIMRYENNPDTDYFELGKFCPSIDTYEMFEKKMDEYMHSTIDHDFYSRYLSKHYTSVRARQLEEIVSKID